MRLTLSPLVAAALLASSPVLAQPGGNAEVLAAEQAFDEAQLHGDRPALERMIAADFLIARGSGRIGDRRDFIDGLTKPGVKLGPFVVTDRLFLRPSPDVAIVGGEARVGGIEDGQRFADRFRFSHTFARRDGRWVLVYAQVTGLPG